MHRPLPIVLGLIVVLTLSACGSDAEITAAFTSRMQSVAEARTTVESRVQTLSSDCEQQRLREVPYCFNGRTFYADDIQADINGWLAAVVADLRTNGSLENIASHDSTLQRALSNAEAFNTWVDELHRFVQQQSEPQGANAAPQMGELIPPIAEAAATVWQAYRDGEAEKVDALVSHIEQQRFATFSEVASR